MVNKYTFADGQYDGFWYDADSTFIGDGKTTLDAADDAATADWGEDWRTPTLAQWLELIDNCTWTWATVNGIKGYTVTGPNENTIFLPAAGNRTDSSTSYAGTYGYYWTADLLSTDSSKASNCYFEQRNNFHGAEGGNYRYIGRSVRAVIPGNSAE